MSYTILQGNALGRLRELPDCSVHCCVTSPPFYGLRDYGMNGQIGLEANPEQYVDRLVEVFREVRRVLRDDGTFFLNLGDSYSGCAGIGRNDAGGNFTGGGGNIAGSGNPGRQGTHKRDTGLKPKDLVGIPWMTAFALRADGWYLRSEIIWCLSGGTWLYARTKKGEMPIMVRDAARLAPSSVKLWNGQKWTQVLGWSRSERTASEIELVLRSGERISCTPTHKFPSNRGLLPAEGLVVGDKLTAVLLPEPETPRRPNHIGIDVAWFAGLYLAEGSMSDDTIQIAGHAKELTRFDRVSKIAKDYGGSATISVDGNNQSIGVYGRVLVALIQQFVSGRIASDKCLGPTCWRYGNEFLRALLDGYLSGDGHWDDPISGGGSRLPETIISSEIFVSWRRVSDFICG